MANCGLLDVDTIDGQLLCPSEVVPNMMLVPQGKRFFRWSATLGTNVELTLFRRSLSKTVYTERSYSAVCSVSFNNYIRIVYGVVLVGALQLGRRPLIGNKFILMKSVVSPNVGQINSECQANIEHLAKKRTLTNCRYIADCHKNEQLKKVDKLRV